MLHRIDSKIDRIYSILKLLTRALLQLLVVHQADLHCGRHRKLLVQRAHDPFDPRFPFKDLFHTYI